MTSALYSAGVGLATIVAALYVMWGVGYIVVRLDPEPEVRLRQAGASPSKIFLGFCTLTVLAVAGLFCVLVGHVVREGMRW